MRKFTLCVLGVWKVCWVPELPPVCPGEVEGRRVTAKSFPLFGLNPVKMSQEGRGLIRCGDTTAAGGVTRKPADRSLNITHTSYDLTSWSVIALLPPRPICLQSSVKMKITHKRSAHTHTHTYTHTHTHTQTGTYRIYGHVIMQLYTNWLDWLDSQQILKDAFTAQIVKCQWEVTENLSFQKSSDILMLRLFTYSSSFDDLTTPHFSAALCQLTTKEQERLCRLCFPVTFYSTASSEWRKPNNRANVSLFNPLSGEQAAPLCMPLLFSEWYRAPQQHWLRKSVSLNTWFVFVAATGGSGGIMCCQSTSLLTKLRPRRQRSVMLSFPEMYLAKRNRHM